MRIMLVVAGLTMLAACGAGDAKPDSTAAVALPAATPISVQIVSPAEGDTVGANVTVVLAAQGVTIEKASGIRVAGFGHFHLFLDSPPSAEDVVIPPNSDHIVHIGSGVSTHTYTALAEGAHEIIAVVGYGDHALMNTIRDTVRFVVKH